MSPPPPPTPSPPTASAPARPARIDAGAPEPSEKRFAANLRAIAAQRPDLAKRLEAAEPARDVEFVRAADGGVTATRGGRALASKRRPLEEAARVVEGIDVREHAVLVTLGFGLGHHVRAVAEKLGGSGMVCVFEPDLPLLRAVLERMDHSAWLGRHRVVFFDDAEDSAAVSRAAYGAEAVFGLGVRFVEHGPSAARLGESASAFGKSVAKAVAALRTSVVTTMVQTEITVRNGLLNAEHYVARAGSGDEGIRDLEGLCEGRPAIVVSAGPSLRKNIQLLRDPAVREKCVIVAVQTVLKTLLAEGIRPHFVTALDYHELSRRFYEGLTAADVEGVTLVAECKVNPSVLDAWPGAIRTPADETLEMILPPELKGDHGSIRSGSTVAQLSYFLARAMGCDPVILTGQDLAFTGGLYYGEGAAIHRVWAPELGPFRTLETLEWERIARARKSLRAVEDADGNDLFTDEQMATYLAQFERLFAEDAERGLTVIDASEGGARKRHAEPETLASALARLAGPGAPPLPEIPVPSVAPASPERTRALRERLAHVRRQTGKLVTLCEQTAAVLEKMRDAGGDQREIGRLIDRAHEKRDEARRLSPGYELAQKINQTGAFNRGRADRDINLSDLSPLERQARQIERDATNVRWLGDAAREVARLLEAAVAAAGGGPKTVAPASATGEEAPLRIDRARGTLPALVVVDHERDSLGRERALTADALRGVIGRLAASGRVSEVVLLSDDEARTMALAGEGAGVSVAHETIDVAAVREHRRGVAAARAWAPDAWRGGIGGATVYDELLHPETLLPVMQRRGDEAALLAGDDWDRLDPGVTAEVVERRLEAPDRHRVVFTQAAPGLAPVAVSRELIEEFAGATDVARPWASLGGMLGYMPFNPLADPVSKSLCVTVDHTLREAEREDVRTPTHVIVELTRERLSRGGQREKWTTAQSGGRELGAAQWIELLRSLTAVWPNCSVSLTGAGDPLMRSDALEIIRAASESAWFTHVRTEPLHGDRLETLAEIADVISLDLYADTAASYEAITGADGFENAAAATDGLLAMRREAGRWKLPYVVPRLTRCDAVIQEIPNFYNKWCSRAGAAVIDALPGAVPAEGCAPLTPPARASERAERRAVAVRADGMIVTGPGDHCAGEPVGSALELTPDEIVSALRAARGMA